MEKTIINMKSVSKKYKETLALENIDLSILKGDFYGFVGPNGSGKSTTIRILLGLINATSGEVAIFNEAASSQRQNILARVGYIPSEIFLYEYLTVQKMIDFSARLRGKESDVKAESERLIQLFDVDATKKIKDLSFGNRRKVSIICALQHQPELYIFDEPSNGLDPLMQATFWEEMQERHRNGATIFVSSHNLTEVQRYCTKAAIIKNGQIITAGSMEELREKAVKRIVIQGLTTVPELEMKDIIQTKQSISFLYRDSIESLLTVLERYKGQITDLSIVEPDLEEVFRHFYLGDTNRRNS